ncbi:MAG TPA: hypothetical protein VFA10_19360 [Ktedonobacteraceae bacterium]|nr:hypothetical protein [Ktedonobacteraceae bacterium]
MIDGFCTSSRTRNGTTREEVSPLDGKLLEAVVRLTRLLVTAY